VSSHWGSRSTAATSIIFCCSTAAAAEHACECVRHTSEPAATTGASLCSLRLGRHRSSRHTDGSLELSAHPIDLFLLGADHIAHLCHCLCAHLPR